MIAPGEECAAVCVCDCAAGEIPEGRFVAVGLVSKRLRMEVRTGSVSKDAGDKSTGRAAAEETAVVCEVENEGGEV